MARLVRDVRTGSRAIVLSRTRAVHEACAVSLRNLESARSGLLDNPAGQPASAESRRRLASSFDELRPVLERCLTEYQRFLTPSRDNPPPELRYALQARNASTQLERSAEVFLKNVGIKIRPFGAGPSPFASESR